MEEVGGEEDVGVDVGDGGSEDFGDEVEDVVEMVAEVVSVEEVVVFLMADSEVVDSSSELERASVLVERVDVGSSLSFELVELSSS